MVLEDKLRPRRRKNAIGQNYIDTCALHQIQDRMTTRLKQADQAAILDEEAALIFGDDDIFQHHAGPPLLLASLIAWRGAGRYARFVTKARQRLQ